MSEGERKSAQKRDTGDHVSNNLKNNSESNRFPNKIEAIRKRHKKLDREADIHPWHNMCIAQQKRLEMLFCSVSAITLAY